MYDDVSQLAELGHFEGPGADYFVDPIITIITIRISFWKVGQRIHTGNELESTFRVCLYVG